MNPVVFEPVCKACGFSFVEPTEIKIEADGDLMCKYCGSLPERCSLKSHLAACLHVLEASILKAIKTEKE